MSVLRAERRFAPRELEAMTDLPADVLPARHDRARVRLGHVLAADGKPSTRAQVK